MLESAADCPVDPLKYRRGEFVKSRAILIQASLHEDFCEMRFALYHQLTYLSQTGTHIKRYSSRHQKPWTTPIKTGLALG